MLTALDHETDRVTGLELGADDYVTKPFSPRELVARVRAVLRRVSGDDSKQDATETVSFGAVEMDPETYIVTVGGRRIDLTSTEFRILYFMANSPGRVFSRSRILDHLWGGEKFVFERTVDVHIRHIREKLGESGGNGSECQGNRLQGRGTGSVKERMPSLFRSIVRAICG